MNKVKVHFVATVSLIVALLLTLAAAVGAALTGRVFASAEVTPVSYAPSAVFAAGGVAGEVGASEGDESYVQFTFRDGGNVYFRRDLAYKWFTADPEADSTLANPGRANYLSMEFTLPALDFETFAVTFESAEESVTKDEKAVNDILFRMNGETLQVAVKDADHRDAENDELAWSDLASGTSAEIALSFAEGENIGEFAVSIACGETTVSGVLTNIGGNYAEYRSSSSSSPNTPITFSMTMPEDAASDAKVGVYMRSLNGQRFLLDEDGQVRDDTAPVLAVSEDVYAFTLGQRYSFTSYEAIDVCRDSVTVTRQYYMAKATENGYEIADESATGTDSAYATLSTSTTFFMPTADNETVTDEYVSVRFSLDDNRKREEADILNEYVYLTWYAADTSAEGGIVQTLTSSDEEDATSQDFIIVTADEKEGPYYVGLTADEETGTNVVTEEFENAVAAYQTAVNEAAAEAGAGEGAYLNLPSLRGLIASDYADYRNLDFTIYYWHESAEVGSSPSNTSTLDYNELRFEVAQEGLYTFRIVATDSSSNAMQLYDRNGELVSLSSSNVGYDDDGEDFLVADIPTFTAYIDYDGATIEDPGSQDYGYRDRSYSIDDFEVIALEGYASDYTLYYIDEDRLADDQLTDGQAGFTYADCVDRAYELFFAENAPYANAVVEINVYNSDVTEDDDEWDDTDNAYHWNPDSSLSFTPQRSGIYLVNLTVTETTGATVSSYMAIEVRNPVDIIPGVSEWLQNNTASVVLFAISGVLLIAIIVLCVIKPSDKKVEEVDIEKLKGKKKSKKD